MKQMNFMILGASILQLPAIIKAKEMGLNVIVLDLDKNAVGLKYADVSLEISTIDTDKVLNAALEYNIDGIMTLASDKPMRTVAKVAKELGIIGISEETAIRATNKVKMRECLEEHNVAIPMFFKIKSYESYIEVANKFKGEFIVKPSDNSGSRGIKLVKNKNEIKDAYNYSLNFSSDGTILVEEYMVGQEVSVEALTVDGITEIIAITDKITTGSPYFVEMGHTQPSQHSTKVQEKIKEITINTINAIGIKFGPSHAEVMVTKEGCKIVEIGARLGGDNITTSLVPLSTGVDMVEASIKIALGIKSDIKKKFDKCSAIRYFETKSGILKEIQGIEGSRRVMGIQEITFTKKVGEEVGVIKGSNDRVGFVIAKGQDREEVIKSCEKALNKINFIII